MRWLWVLAPLLVIACAEVREPEPKPRFALVIYVPTATATATPTLTPSPTSTPPVLPTITPSPTATPIPPTPTPAPAAPPPVYAAEMALTESEVAAILAQQGAAPELMDQYLRVAKCESRYRPGARNGIYLGLFQLSPHWFEVFGYPVEQWADPNVNARVAVLLREYLGGFNVPGGWSCWAGA